MLFSGTIRILKSEGVSGVWLATRYVVRRASVLNGLPRRTALARTSVRTRHFPIRNSRVRARDLVVSVRITATPSTTSIDLDRTLKSIELNRGNFVVKVVDDSQSLNSLTGPTEKSLAQEDHADALSRKSFAFTWHANAGDELLEGALPFLLQAVKAFPSLAACYSDYVEDGNDLSGSIHAPCFDPILLSHQDYVRNAVFTNDEAFGGTPNEVMASTPFADLVKNTGLPVDSIVHIPRTLFRLRGERRASSRTKQGDPKARTLPSVTIIIPTKDRLDLLEPCVSSLLRFDAGVDFEVLIVDNGSVEKSTQAYFESLPKNVFRVIRDEGDFNFSRLNNFAARQASNEILCLLNNDTEVTSDFWLSNLVGSLSDSVKVVGPLLLYPDGSVQHAGVVLGLGGIADHAFRGEESSSNRHMNYIHIPRACSAVTAACLVVRKEVYFEVGGLSEAFQVGFNDVDFCLRVGKLGGRVVYDPRVSLIHKESKSRGVDKGERAIRAGIEVVKMVKIWGNALTEDPFYNPNLSLNAEQSFFAIAKRN